MTAETSNARGEWVPGEGEEIMVNTPYDVFILPLRPSGLDGNGPRFVVHVPGPEQPAAVDGAKETDLWRCTVCGRVGTVGRCCGEETRERANMEQLLAENERLRDEVERLRDDGASAVRWAPGSAYWSEVLVELFGPDARKGIDVLEARWRKEIERAERLAEALRPHIEDLERSAVVLDQYPAMAPTAAEMRKAAAELRAALHPTAARDAEIEALRAEVETWKTFASGKDRLWQESVRRAERLAEALRKLEEREQSDEALLRQALEALERGAWDTLSGRNAAFAIRERLGLGQEE